MAKVNNPLFSSNATGSLGKTLTYCKWHGVDVVKTHSKPANPQSSAQQAQRSLYGQALEYYREGGLTEVDLEAWRRWARVSSGFMSHYNLFMRECIRSLKEGTYYNFHDFVIYCPPYEGNPCLEIHKSGYGSGGVVKYGASPRGLIHSKNMDDLGSSYRTLIEDWPDKSNMYFQFMEIDETNKSGIYQLFVVYS
jgi:hypothetical protein